MLSYNYFNCSPARRQSLYAKRRGIIADGTLLFTLSVSHLLLAGLQPGFILSKDVNIHHFLTTRHWGDGEVGGGVWGGRGLDCTLLLYPQKLLQTQ